MPEFHTDPFSQVPVFVKLYFGLQELSDATAFFYTRNGKLYLISNWHVFSGRHPKTKIPLSSHAGIPDGIWVNAMLNDRLIKRAWVKFPLTFNKEPLWLEHPKLRSEIDIAALPVELDEAFKSYHFSDLPSEQMSLGVSHDVFVLGYPHGILAQAGLPIWKRASVATEPNSGGATFFVDTATSPGMSGSPVVFRYRGFFKRDLESSFITPGDEFGEGTRFVGVYSGRLGAQTQQVQLGIVWKSFLIDEIIDGETLSIAEQ
jgi:Trypsin-like peptidase domain